MWVQTIFPVIIINVVAHVLSDKQKFQTSFNF